jgi:small subunit ribosomal protein S8
MDIVANTLTKIRNAAARKMPKVDVPKSGIIGDILSVMKKEGYIIDHKDSSESKYSYTVLLKYANGKSAIAGLKRVSKLSRRVYVKIDSIPRVFNNLGIAVITTSKGVLTDKEAKALGVGGEVICYIW